jgi:hypothetical protein
LPGALDSRRHPSQPPHLKRPRHRPRHPTAQQRHWPRSEGLATTRAIFYVAVPGSLSGRLPKWRWPGRARRDNNYAFVKRITWDYAASMSPRTFRRGRQSSDEHAVSGAGRLGAIDLATDRLVWTTTLQVLKGPQVSADARP